MHGFIAGVLFFGFVGVGSYIGKRITRRWWWQSEPVAPVTNQPPADPRGDHPQTPK